MSSKSFFEISDFKVGDEIWWFKSYLQFDILPGEIELVHDTIRQITEDYLLCLHTIHKPSSVWGKTRKEAWENFKRDLGKWGSLD